MGDLKVGIIGAGLIATQVHIPNYLQYGHRVKVVAIADAVIEKAQQAAKKFGIPHTFHSFKEMFAEVELDAVSICVPNKFHAEATIAALESGCHVLCEKPPAMNAAEAQLMLETANKVGKLLTYGFHFRHSKKVKIIKIVKDMED